MGREFQFGDAAEQAHHELRYGVLAYSSNELAEGIGKLLIRYCMSELFRGYARKIYSGFRGSRRQELDHVSSNSKAHSLLRLLGGGAEMGRQHDIVERQQR